MYIASVSQARRLRGPQLFVIMIKATAIGKILLYFLRRM